MRAVAALLAFLSCAGCANTATSSAPSQQTGSGSLPAATWTVSGTVWVAGVVGVEVATRGSAFAWIESGAGDPGHATDAATITSDGHYELTIPASTKRLRLQGPLYQPCAITIAPHHALVEVPEALVDRVIRALSKTKLRGQSVEVRRHRQER